MRRTLIGLAATAATLGTAPAAMAQPAVGLLGGGANDALATFDTTAPGTITSSRAITGLVGGERLQGIDFRWIPAAAAPAGTTAGLYGLGHDPATGGTHIYRIDLATAVATPIGAGFTRASTADFGFDFNPAVDRIRVVDSSDDNYRAHPDTGAFVVVAPPAAPDAALTPAGQGVSAAAYDRVNVAPATPTGPTTLFVINPTTDQLATQGDVNSAPASPNGGVLKSVGSLGVDAIAGPETNFDIAFDGKAYATLRTATGDALYSVDTTTGAATRIGALNQTLLGLAIVPGTVQFLTNAYSNSERSGANITVTRTAGIDTAATVNYATGGGTADGSDYTPTTGTLTFAPGETVKSFPIALTDDSIREDEETIGLALSAPSNGTALGSLSAATLTIVDNDGPVTPPAPTPAPADTIAPTAKLSTVRSTYSRAAFLKGITVRVAVNENAKIEATLNAKVTRATAARALAGSYNLELTGKKVGFGTGTRTIKLTPKKALFGTPKKSVKVRLKVVVEDLFGNDRTVTKTFTVKR